MMTMADDPGAESDSEAAEFSPLHPVFADAPDSVSFRKLRKRLVRQVQEAMRLYGMLPPPERVEAPAHAKGRPRWLVCLSGGKDSYTLLSVLLDLKWQGALPVDLLACNLDQGQPGFPKHVLPDYLAKLGVDHRIVTEDTYSIVTEKVPASNTYCALCSRLRRGILYRVAREEGCSAVVLGHHRDDSLETFMLNFLHGGRLAAMPPKLVNDVGDLYVLRPDPQRRGRHPHLRGGDAVPDHPVQSLRQSGRSAAHGGEGDARRVGKEEPRQARGHVPRSRPCPSLAPDGRGPVRFRRTGPGRAGHEGRRTVVSQTRPTPTYEHCAGEAVAPFW